MSQNVEEAKKNGASDRNRTGDNHVGNVMLYQLSYTRLSLCSLIYHQLSLLQAFFMIIYKKLYIFTIFTAMMLFESIFALPDTWHYII